MRHVHVVGSDPVNMPLLRHARPDVRFHEVLTHAHIRNLDRHDFDELLHDARRILSESPHPRDAIVGYWDFPVSALVPMLRREFGLAAPSLDSLLKCEHKYWSRLEQATIIPQHTPGFSCFNPYAQAPLEHITLPYPFWIKPIKSFSSHLGFRIGRRRDFEPAIARIRSQLPRIAQSFNQFLEHVDLPEKIATIDGYYCLAEAITPGHQCTLEGYVFDGRVEVYGIVDSFRLANLSSFDRYQYPSQLPRAIQNRMIDIARHIMEHIGFDHSPFNIEFFYSRPAHSIKVLEINARISQSHSELFRHVDGDSNHGVMIDVGLNRAPGRPWREGPHRVAAKCFLRRRSDATVTAVPDTATLERLQERFPGTSVHLNVEPGMRLSSLLNQDSYSYELGYFILGAGDRRELVTRQRIYREALMSAFAFDRP